LDEALCIQRDTNAVSVDLEGLNILGSDCDSDCDSDHRPFPAAENVAGDAFGATAVAAR